MCNDNIIRRIAGIFILVSVTLGWTVHPYFFFFTAVVGFNLLQSSFTGFCPLERMLGKTNAFGCSPNRPTP